MLHAIVLAAGASSRMGRPKPGLALDSAGDTFVWRLCRTLLSAGLPGVTVVTGAAPEAVAAACPARRRGVRLVHNPAWERGQLSSLLVGLDAVDTPETEAILVALVDTPLVAGRTVALLVSGWRRTRAPVVRPSRDGAHGHPVIFDRMLFDELRMADPAAGAKEVVRRHGSQIADIAVDDPGAFRDFDTPEDLALLRHHMRYD